MSVNNTYICVDNSGSTSGQPGYWNKVRSIVSANPLAKYILWNSHASIVTHTKMVQTYEKQDAGGGTEPTAFIPLLKDCNKLILVTDGDIYESEIKKCEKLLEGVEFDKVDVYIIQTINRPNLSISSLFTRKTDFMIQLNDGESQHGSTKHPVDLEQYYGKPNEFIANYNNIYQTLLLQNIGKHNEDLRNRVLDLQRNLLSSLSTKKDSSEYDNLRQSLLTSQGPLSSQVKAQLTNITEDSNMDDAKKIELYMRQLVEVCTNQMGYDLNLLQPNRLLRATTISKPKTEELPREEEFADFVCPIVMGTDMPVLMIKKGEPVFKDVEKQFLELLITNPLMTLQNNEFREKIKSRIDHTIGLEAFVEHERRNMVSPMTRSPISSVISFGQDATHKKATDYALADIFFGRKLVGVPELWLSVVYFIVLNMDYLSENKDFITIYEDSMKQRMMSNYTNITLTGLVVEPMVKTPVDIALWYCLVSPVVNKFNGIDSAVNRLRSFGAASRFIMKLVDLFGYNYDKESTIKRCKYHRAFWWMMNQEKDDNNYPKKWRNMMRAQYQKSMTLETGEIILLDCKPTERPQLPVEFDDLSLGELLYLESKVDASKSTNLVWLDLRSLNVPQSVKNYGYPNHYVEDNFGKNTTVHHRTFRPYVIDPKLRKHWKECSEEQFGPLDKQLSAYNYFIIYVNTYTKYPTKDEFYSYLYHKQLNREHSFDTLPEHVKRIVDGLFMDYERVLGEGFKDVDPQVFKDKTFKSMSEVDRLAIENS